VQQSDYERRLAARCVDDVGLVTSDALLVPEVAAAVTAALELMVPHSIIHPLPQAALETRRAA